MKTLGTLATHYAGSVTTLALLVKITRTDAQVFGFTTHDRALTYLGVEFLSSNAAPSVSDLQHSAGLEVDNGQIDGALNDSVTESDAEAGLWSSARVEVWRVNWADLTQGHEVLGVGELGEIGHDGRRYTVEFTGRTHKLGRIITRHYLPSCDADLGDARCGVDLEALRVAGTVSATSSNRNFTDSMLAQAADYFTYGVVTWVTGANAGRSMEVKDHAAGGVFTLQLGMARTIAIGDTFTVVPGCNKLLRTAEATFGGDCKVKFSNAANFRGFDLVPGIDAILRPVGV